MFIHKYVVNGETIYRLSEDNNKGGNVLLDTDAYKGFRSATPAQNALSKINSIFAEEEKPEEKPEPKPEPKPEAEKPAEPAVKKTALIGLSDYVRGFANSIEE